MNTSATASAPRILVVVGTPLAGSLNHALARAYADAAREAGAQVETIDLATDPIPSHPATRGELRMPREGRDDAPLEEATARYIEQVAAADHIVMFFPQWWGTYPAAFKSWIDRVLLSGSAFEYAASGRGWHRRLKGRSARIVMTMDSPGWWNRLLYRDAAVRSLRTATLWYCGVKVKHVNRVAEVRHTSPEGLAKAIERIGHAGATDARRVTARTATPVAVPTA